MADEGAENGTIAGFAPAARARARLALRAEQAWGVGALLGVGRINGTAQHAAIQAQATAATATARAPRGCSPDARVLMDPPSPVVDPAATSAGMKPATLAGEDPPFASPPLPRQRRVELLQGLDDSEVKGCTRCPLCQARRTTVFGEGDPEARLMFIGEGPGETEDATGRPFVGKAGALLDRMIAGMGLAREQVYIANVVKCRPPGNRVPTPLEVETCTPYLHKQIEWVRPHVIVTLGLPAARHLLNSPLSMGRLRGQWNQWRGIKVMPTYHPAYLLRSYTDANRRIVWGDLQQVMGELGLVRSSARGS